MCIYIYSVVACIICIADVVLALLYCIPFIVPRPPLSFYLACSKCFSITGEIKTKEKPGNEACNCIHNIFHGSHASVSRYLNYSLSRVRVQDSLSVIGYISGNVHGRYLAWYYVRNNWEYIIEV